MSSVIPALIGGLAGLGGALGNRATTTTSTETPNFDLTQLGLRNAIIKNYMQMLAPGNLDLSGYQANAIQDINKNRQLQQQQLREQLAARGIQGPAAELAVQNVNNDRFADITHLQNSIPLLRQQLMGQVAQGAGAFFNSSPYGRTTISKGAGNVAGGAVGGAGSALAYLYGQGAFNNQPQVPATTWASTIMQNRPQTTGFNMPGIGVNPFG